MVPINQLLGILVVAQHGIPSRIIDMNMGRGREEQRVDLYLDTFQDVDLIQSCGREEAGYVME
jgi:hypothetical protein